jgi:hypothetical protein
MSTRTIAKFSAVVICLTALAGCKHVWSDGKRSTEFDPAAAPYVAPREIGRIESNAIQESSGLAASKCQSNVFWTHNDSGDGPYIFAIDQSGKELGTFKVTGAENNDWEDIDTYKDAAGTCYVYIGEIGNNEGKRDRTAVYRVKEPQVTPDGAATGRKDAVPTDPAESVTVNYPETRPNAETLLVRPQTGEIYILTKRTDAPSSVYKVAPNFGGVATAEKVGEIKVPSVPNGQLTGGDVAPDGRRVVVCDYVAGYELRLPDGDDNFDHIWLQTPVKFNVGERKGGEAIAYSADGTKVYSTSEGKNPPIYEMDRK